MGILRIGLFIAWCFCSVWAQAPRLLAHVQAPSRSMGVWVRGDLFGIEGQWDYNVDPTGQDWCWNGRQGRSCWPLPEPCLIEHVDARTLTALIRNDKNRWFHWTPAADGAYHTVATSKKRYHGSENPRPCTVEQPSRHKVFWLESSEVRAYDSRNDKLLARVRLDEPYTLALQPNPARLLAVAAPHAVHLLSAETLRTVSTIPVAEVKDLAFDPTGVRLATLTHSDQIRIYQVSSKPKSPHPLLKRLWMGGVGLTPKDYRELVLQWECQTGQFWWDP